MTTTTSRVGRDFHDRLPSAPGTAGLQPAASRVGRDFQDRPSAASAPNIYDAHSTDRYRRSGLDGLSDDQNAICWRPFTRVEDSDLLLALEEGATVAEIALDLGRPQWHVDCRIRQLLASRVGRDFQDRPSVPAVAVEVPHAH